jgi:alpha-L-fucosidase
MSGEVRLDRPVHAVPGAEWFTGAGLGVFVHWDHASQQGLEISWPLVGRSIIPGVDQAEDDVTVAQYQQSAATFDPTSWDAKALARLIKDAGATYAVFTVRHHAGFSMYHTEWSDFGIEHSPYHEDLTRQFVEAVRAEGVRVGLYYSLSDWNHPDYPAFRDEDRPYPLEHWPHAGMAEYAGTPDAEDRHRRPTAEQWARYQEYLRGQLTELLTNYGQIDLLWFDGEWERSAQEWDTAGLRELIKELQPDVLINSRLQGHGDYATPEQGFPIVAPDGPWELCLTIGDMWGYRPGDTRFKSARSLVRTLVETAARGGNLLLNIGPRGDGSLVPEHVERFEEIGRWLDRHGESIVGARPSQGVDFYGPTTVSASGDALYLHLVMLPVDEVVVRGIPIGRVKRVRRLADGAELDFTTNVEVHGEGQQGGESLGELVIQAPAPSGALVDVLAIDFA